MFEYLNIFDQKSLKYMYLNFTILNLSMIYLQDIFKTFQNKNSLIIFYILIILYIFLNFKLLYMKNI